MVYDHNPKPQKPAEIDLDHDEMSVGETRECPVCIKKEASKRPESIVFDNFGLMMRHWEKCHPNVAPPGDSDNSKPYNEMVGVIMDLSDSKSTCNLDLWFEVNGLEEKE